MIIYTSIFRQIRDSYSCGFPYFSNGSVFWQELFPNINPKLQFKEFSAEELVLAKYFRNSFFTKY